MSQHVLELEALFKDHGVYSGITNSLVLERAVYDQRALVQPLPTAFQLQILDLTHVWSDRDSGAVHSDFLALAVAVYTYIKPHLSPQQRYRHSFPELLAAFTLLLVERQPDDVPVFHNASFILRVVHAELRMMQPPGYELTTLTPWLGLTSSVSGSRCGSPLQLAIRADSVAFFANQIAATHLRDVPFSLTTASQARIVAWFVSELLWWRLSNFTQH